AAALLPAGAEPRVVAELARTRHGVPTPQPPAARGVVGIEEPARAELAAGDPDEDLVLHDERRTRDAVAEHRVGDLDLPERRSGARVERDQCRVERADVQPVAEDGHAAIERVDLVGILDFLRARVSPDLPSGPRVER